MVPLQVVRTHNKSLKYLGARLVAIFVGGTSGIGLYTAREFVRHTPTPAVYLVGRNDTSARQIIQDLKSLNKAADIHFIKADVSLLKEIDRLRLLGFPRFPESDRNLETVEGLDRKLSLHYYGRMRFIQNLIPHLANASHVGNRSTPLARVVSVLGAGHETMLHLDDLDLREHYSVEACDVHATTMTSLMVKEFASRYPSVTFIHTYPGIVKSGIAREAGPVLRHIITAAMFLGRLWMVSKQESGERHLFAATSDKFAPNTEARVGEISKGAYLLNWDDSEVGNEALLEDYLVNGVGDTVWTHTKKIFSGALDYHET